MGRFIRSMAESGVRAESCDSTCPVCELCGTLENLLVCAGCKETYYCSKEHQRNHWKRHKPFCCERKKGTPSGNLTPNINTSPSPCKMVERSDNLAVTSSSIVDSGGPDRAVNDSDASTCYSSE